MPAGPCTIGEVVTLGSPIALRGSPDMEAVGHAVHGFLAADRPGLLAEDRDSMASDLLERFAVAGSLAAREVIEVADRFHAWLAERFPAARLHREFPEQPPVERAERDLGPLKFVWDDDRPEVFDAAASRRSRHPASPRTGTHPGW